MRSLRPWLLIAILPWLAGCPSIYSEQPLGEEAAVLDPHNVNGTWLTKGALFGVRVLDAQRDTFIYWIVQDFSKNRPARCEPPPNVRPCGKETSDDDAAECNVRRYTIPDGGYVYFYSEKQGHDAKEYATPWIGLSDGKEYFVLYFVAAQEKVDSRLKELVQKGALPGQLNPNGELILGPLSRDHYQLILSPENGLFEWATPVALIKLPSELDPCKKGENPK